MGVNAMGFSVEEIPVRTVGRQDFVSKEGNLLPNLPVDPYHLKRWQDRGFRVATKEDYVKVDPLVCSMCGAGPFKAKIGLLGHMRTHTKS